MFSPPLAIALGITHRVDPEEAVLDVLRALQAEGEKEITIDCLAAAVGVSTRTVSRALNRLESRGAIERDRSGWRRTYVYHQVGNE